MHRSQYLHARQTLGRLLELGVVPVVNENDAVADEEIRFGDNDRLAALVAHLVGADLLVLLTDTAGLLTGDPTRTADTSLIEEVVEIDHELELIAGGPDPAPGSGGMGSKLAAAKIAVWSGIEAVIADAARPGRAGLGDRPGRPGWAPGSAPASAGCPARKLWIAFAIGASGTIVVDDGARRALVERGTSLLPAGVVSVRGRVRRRRRRRDGRPRRRGIRQGPGAPSLVTGRIVGRPADRPSCPRTCRPRSSTGTTWSSWADRRARDRGAATGRYAESGDAPSPPATVAQLGRRHAGRPSPGPGPILVGGPRRGPVAVPPT